MRWGLDDAESALFRMRAEFKEMPGLKITAAQATRLWQIDPNRSEELLNALVVDGLLRRSPDGTYLLSSEPCRRSVRL
jgi:DNA-binding IclR family transcriptional regulator